MSNKNTSPRDRVNQAIHFQKPDRTPRDFAAVPEIWEKLGHYFGTSDRQQILQHLAVDIRIVSYDSYCRHPDVDQDQVDSGASMERSSTGGMWRKIEADGSNRDIWGAHRRRVKTSYGAFDEFASHPLAAAQDVDDLKAYRWPEPEWWDFHALRSDIANMHTDTVYNIRYRMGSVFETAWSLYGFEKFLLDMALRPDMPMYVMQRVAGVHLENLRIVLESAGDLIDIVYYYDDIASQDGLLISPDMYRTFIMPFHQQIIATTARYGKPAMMHCCGAVYPMINTLIDMGLSILNPIQPSVPHMDPDTLAKEFSGRLAFHGGIDVQKFLPSATPSQVRDKVASIADTLGRNGGYIMAGSHHIQADAPLDNVLAMYGI